MKLIVIDGGKGGVGKSHMATAVADRLLAAGAKIAALDGDVTNPDFCRIYQERGDVPSIIIDLTREENFVELFGVLESLRDDGVEYAVLSCAAGTTEIENLGALAEEALQALEIEVVTLFVLSRIPDSVNLAGRSLDRGFAAVAMQRMAIMNGIHGKPEEFARWHESPERKAWLKSGGKETHIRELYHRVADSLRDNGITPTDLLGHLNTVYRIQLNHWLREFDDNIMRPLGLPCPPAPATAAGAKGKAPAEAEKKEAAA